MYKIIASNNFTVTFQKLKIIQMFDITIIHTNYAYRTTIKKLDIDLVKHNSPLNLFY